MKTTTKSAFHRGFTLIELMIVIVILGILMGTILPRLSGAQGRARDTARLADLGNMAQVLELYYSDFGEYPSNNAAGATDCIEEVSNSDGTGNALVTADLSNYIKGGTFPVPPNAAEAFLVGGTTCTGEYGYLAVTARGQANQGFVLFTNVETATKSNAIAVGYAPIINGTSTGTDVPDVAFAADIEIGEATAWTIRDELTELIAFDNEGGYNWSIYILASGT